MQDIEVVIPSTQGTLHPDLVRALQSQTCQPTAVHLIHDVSHRGASWARNTGLKLCRATYVACLDDDCLPPPNWLAEILAAFNTYHADIVGGTYEESDRFLAQRRARQGFPRDTGIDLKGKVGAGGNIAFRRQTLEELKSERGYIYAPTFRMAEDWELVWALRIRGAKTVFLGTRVTHLKIIESLEYWKQQWGRGEGIYRLSALQPLYNGRIPVHKSQLWSDQTHSRVFHTLRLLWLKGLGPFDRSSFTSWKYFLRMWVGEKVQAAGYLYARIMNPVKPE